MTEQSKYNMSWVFVATALFLGAIIFNSSWSPVNASDHEDIRDLRYKGEIIPLSKLLGPIEQKGMKVLEAELEKEHGKLVYELEILDANGRIFEQYYDAVTGEALKDFEED